MSIITTFESQCRALTSTISPDEDTSRFIVGTLIPDGNNLLHVFEYKDDNNNLAKVSYKFPHGEVWHLSTSSRYPNLVAAVTSNKNKFRVGVYRLPDELEKSIEDDYGLSESPIDIACELQTSLDAPLRQSQWHPDDGYQILTSHSGHMTIWDIENQKEVRKFALTSAVERCLDLEGGSIKSSSVCDLRWSSLFDCSVIAAAVGSKIYGVDTRIPDSNSASLCWLIDDQHCNRIRSIDFNPNSQYYIASGGDDCRAKFWDLRQTTRPSLHMQSHTHWIWSIRYNPFHDQLVLSAGSDARVVLMRAQTVASDPYGQVVDDEETSEAEETKAKPEDNDEASEVDKAEDAQRDNKKADNEVISVFEEHDDSIYAAEWATDPWIFASLGFDNRFVISRVPKAEKFSILF